MLSLKTNVHTVAVSFNSTRSHKTTTISCKASSTLDMRSKSKTNLYKVLSLESENVGFEEIKKAYRSLALRYHPDVCPASKKAESTRMFVELTRAYETLTDPVSRREYDHQLAMMTTNESEGFSVWPEFSREKWEVQLRNLVRRSEHREREKARRI